MDQHPHNTPALHLFLVKNILKLLTILLDKHKITYFVDGGTLLACVREKDIILHDDDADIGVFHKDYNSKQLQIVLDEISKTIITIDGKDYHVLFEKGPFITKVFIPELWCTTESGRVIATPTIDIFNWTCKKDVIQLTSLSHRKQFKNCFYKHAEMFPLTAHTFGDFEVLGAQNPLPYLHRYYGEDCLRVARIDMRAPTQEQMLAKSTEQFEFSMAENLTVS